MGIPLSLEKVLISYKLMISFFITFIILMIVLMMTNKNGFNKLFGYEIFVTMPILLLITYLIKELFEFKNNKTSFFSHFAQSNQSWFVPAVMLFILCLGIFGFFIMLYVAGIFSDTPPENNTSMILNFIIIISFIITAIFIYSKYKNKDNEILKNLPRTIQLAFNLRSKYTFLFIIFILFMTILYFVNPGGFMTSYGGPIMFFTLFVGIIMIIMVTIYQYYLSNPSKSNLLNETPSPLIFIIKGFYILASIGISLGLIYGLLKLLGVFNQDDSKSNNWGHIVFNILMLCGMLGIIYKLVNAGGFLDKNPYYRLILNILLYIPCLLITLTNVLFGFTKNASFSQSPPKPFEIKILILSLILLGSYFAWFFIIKNYIYSRYLKQGGKQLINQPIKTNILTNVSSYQNLSGNDKFNYQYAISFWFYLDAFAPTSHNKIVSILSYGENPAMKYSSENNMFYITVKQKTYENDIVDVMKEDGKMYNWNDIKQNIEDVKMLPFGNDIDADGNRIIYKHSNVKLQKWNNILLNYNGGTLDVFYNGELVKSAIEVVPYMKYDMLTVGSDNGVSGNVANLMYFEKPLNYYTVNTLYTSLKNNNPPVISTNNDRLIHI